MTTETHDSINDIRGERTPHVPGREWPVRVDEQVSDTPEHWVRGTCVLCSHGCQECILNPQRQPSFFLTRIKQVAPQSRVVV